MPDASIKTQTWQTRASDKRRQCQDLIPEAWRVTGEGPGAASVSLGLVQPLEKSRNDLIDLDIPRRSGILTAKELRITESYDVRRLLDALASGELTALEVTVAFCKRAAIAQQLVRNRRRERAPHATEADYDDDYDEI